MRSGSMFAVIIFAVFLARTAAASREQIPPDLITDRPDRTESSALVPPGMVQFEGGVEWAGTNDGGADTRTMSPAVLTRVAVSGWVEGRIGVSFLRERTGPGHDTRSRAGLSEFSLGGKVRLTDRLATILTVTLPVGGLTTESPGAEAILAASILSSERMGLGVNLGGGRDGTTQAWTMTATAALGVSLGDHTGGFFEVFGGAAEGARPDFWVDGGITWAVARNVQLDLSTGIRLVPAGTAWIAGGGLSVRLPG